MLQYETCQRGQEARGISITMLELTLLAEWSARITRARVSVFIRYIRIYVLRMHICT